MDGHYAGDTSYQSKCHRAGMSWRKCKRVYLELTSISLHVSHFHKKAKQNQTYIHQYPLAELLQKAESNIFVSPHTANRLNEASIGHVSLLLQLLPGQNTGVGSRFLLLGIFPTQGSNPGLLHCGWILFQLNHQGSPGILEWVDYPFCSGTSRPRSQTGVSCIAGRFFTS